MILEGTDLMVLETVADANGKAQFALESQNWFMGDVDINKKNVAKTVHFNPALPYMYVPSSDFSQLTNNITDPTLFPNGQRPVVTDETNTDPYDRDNRFLFWDMSCEDV